MPEEKLQTLSLQVINGSELESGRAARCLFTQQGNVGHGPECHWSVQDRQQSIPARLLPLSCTMAHFVCARRRHNCG